MIKYFIAYEYSYDNVHGSRNAQIVWHKPISGMNDINGIADRIKELTLSGVPHAQVVILTWQRFEPEEDM